MHCSRLKLRAAATLPAAVLMISTSAAHADPHPEFNRFTLRAPADTASAIAPESVSQMLTPSHLALQGAQLLFLKLASKTSNVVNNALEQIGIRYRWGGSTPKRGFDCSGLVHYVFQNTLGLTLPRRAEQMSRVGHKIAADDLQPGDLVFFNTRRRTFSHVGIFIGDNQFVHSPSTGQRVRIDSLGNRYWEKRFTGARRLESPVQTPLALDTKQGNVSSSKVLSISSENALHLAAIRAFLSQSSTSSTSPVLLKSGSL